MLARGGSHRTTTDAELVRWGADVARIEGRTGARRDRGRARPAGLRRRRRAARGSGSGSTASPGARRRSPSGCASCCSRPRTCSSSSGSPSLRRATLDQLAATLVPGYAAELATYGRALQQRNGLLRAIRDETAVARGAALLGPAVPRRRRRGRRGPPRAPARGSRRRWPPRTPRSRPEEAAAGALGLEYVTNAPAGPDETPRDALARRLAETAEKELWNGTTLVGPHRDDVAFVMAGRDLAAFASRGQQRTAILALKLAELDLVTRARRPAAAPAPRRRLLRARPGPAGPPRPPDRRAAAGVRDDDDARRPRPGAARDRDALGGPAEADGARVWLGRLTSRRRRARRTTTTSRAAAAPMSRIGDLMPAGGRAARPRGRAPAGPLPRDLRRDRRRARARGPRRLPGAPGRGRDARRRGGRADRRPGARCSTARRSPTAFRHGTGRGARASAARRRSGGAERTLPSRPRAAVARRSDAHDRMR